MSHEQLAWDWLVTSTKPLLRPDEVARYIGRSVDFVYDIIAEGQLEAFAPPNRDVQRKVITRRSVLLYLAESAQSHPEFLAERAVSFLKSLDPATRKTILDKVKS